MQDPPLVDVLDSRGELDKPVQDQGFLEHPPRPLPLPDLLIQVSALWKTTTARSRQSIFAEWDSIWRHDGLDKTTTLSQLIGSPYRYIHKAI